MGGSFFQDTEGALLPGKLSVFEQGNYSSEFPLQCSFPGREWSQMDILKEWLKIPHIQIELPRKAFIKTKFLSKLFLQVSGVIWPNQLET